MKIANCILCLTLSAAFFLTGCKYDDNDLWDEVNQQAARLASLEQWQQSVNGNITALQELVLALQNNDYVTGVAEFDTPAPGGYRITFTKSGEATIWNGAKGEQGENGATGHSPAIGVKEFPVNSGIYYWTLDGEFIEPEGLKVPITGPKGENGTTPTVTIGSNGNWYISADGTAVGTPPGDGWANTGVKATGDKGDTGATGPKGEQGEAIFAAKGVSQTDETVTFTLANEGGTITLPKYKTIGISFVPIVFLLPEQTKEIKFTSTGTDKPTSIRVVDVPENWIVEVDMEESKFIVSVINNLSGNTGVATVLVANKEHVAAMYALPLSNTGIESNTVGAYYYNRGKVSGIIYRPNNGTPGSGRVVSLDESPSTIWSVLFYDCGVTSEEDGMANMIATYDYAKKGGGIGISGLIAMEWITLHKNNYNANYYSSDRTGIWYLPARNELKELYTVWNGGPGTGEVGGMRTTFNSWLTSAGGTVLNESYYYWSSTTDKPNVFNFNFSNGMFYSIPPTSTYPHIRSVLKF